MLSSLGLTSLSELANKATKSVTDSLASLEKSADQVLGYTTGPGEHDALPSLAGLEHGGFLVGAPEEIGAPQPVATAAGAAAPVAQPPPRVDVTPTRGVSPRSSGVADEGPARRVSGVQSSNTTPRGAVDTPGARDTPGAEPVGEESPRGERPAAEAEPRALLLTPTALVSASVPSTHRGDGGPGDSAADVGGDVDGGEDGRGLAAQLAERTAQVADLQARLAQREAALERAALAAGALAAAEGSSGAHDDVDVAQLQAKLAAKTRECEEARKALQRQGDAAALVAEKDGIITQVMAEGQALSKKVGDLEAAQKKLRASLKEALSEREKLAAKLAAEEAKAAQAEATSAEAVRKALVEVTDTKQFYAAEMQKMQGAAADADARAGLERRLRDAHEKEARLEDKVAALTAQLSRAVEEASRREDGLRAEVSAANARCNEAEARHEELSARMPEATRPLLRQVEALQRAAAEQAGVWAATEAALCARADAADAAASKAATSVASAREALQVAQARAAAATEAEAVATAALAACRQECAQLRVALETARAEAAASAAEAATVASQTAAARTTAVSTETALRGQLADWRARAEALEVSSQLQAKQADARVGELTQQVVELQQQVDELTARTAASHAAAAPTSAPVYTGGPYRQSARVVPGLAGHEEALVERRLASLEAAKQRLSDELVAMTSRATAAEAAATEAGHMRQRLAACVTLLGERDEHVEELTADIVELRKLAQRQAEALATVAERDRAARRSVLDGGHAAAAAVAP